MPRSFRRRGGFTLIEGLVAAVIFLLGMLALLSAFLQARRSNANARRDLLVSAVLSDMAEQINLWPYQDPRLIPSGGWCAMDPTDVGGLLTDVSTFKTIADGCMYNETRLKSTAGTLWGGVFEQQFPSGPNDVDTFHRYFVVQERNVNGAVLPAAQAHSGVRKVIWATVLYAEGNEVRRVSTQVVKVRQAGLRGF